MDKILEITSGKGGNAYLMQNDHGINLPRA